MATYVDTSAILAVLDADDENHGRADTVWNRILAEGSPLVATNYVLVEAFTLIQRRLGLAAANAFVRDLVPVLRVEWVGEAEHRAAISAVLAAGRRRLSLVDCVSFEVMRRLRLRKCFAFDAHFTEQGFQRLT